MFVFLSLKFKVFFSIYSFFITASYSNYSNDVSKFVIFFDSKYYSGFYIIIYNIKIKLIYIFYLYILLMTCNLPNHHLGFFIDLLGLFFLFINLWYIFFVLVLFFVVFILFLLLFFLLIFIVFVSFYFSIICMIFLHNNLNLLGFLPLFHHHNIFFLF